MALALSGQMGLICRIVDSRYKKKLLVIKIYEHRVHADEMPSCCYLKFNTSSLWGFFLFCFHPVAFLRAGKEEDSKRI